YRNGGAAKSTFNGNSAPAKAPAKSAPQKSTITPNPPAMTEPTFEPEPNYAVPAIDTNADQRVYLSITPENANGDTISRLWHICRNHPGSTEVWLRIDTGVRSAQMRVSHSYYVHPSSEFEREAAALLGHGNVRLPVANESVAAA